MTPSKRTFGRVNAPNKRTFALILLDLTKHPTSNAKNCRSAEGRELLFRFAALRHNREMQALAYIGGQLVDFVAAENLDGLACGVEDDFAVAALFQVNFDLGARLGGNGLVEDVVENLEKLSAGHASTPFALGWFPCGPFSFAEA